MSNLQSGANSAQMIELLNTIKFPIMGAGGGFAPIGTINSYMGTTAPLGWLVCDGQTYNISDYPDLATHIASHFGSTNFFGGDGTTTFAVPDLRGEFLRGSGTNSHTNQGDGANVGVHQDGTEHSNFYGTAVSSGFFANDNYHSPENFDTLVGETGKTNPYFRYVTGKTQDGDTMDTYTSRPTNTSVLYIIKATLSDADIDAYTVYSPNERQVGWWQETVDGVLKQKPVYEKTYIVTNATLNKIIEDYSQKQMIDYSGIYLHTDGNRLHFPYYYGSTTMQMNQIANSGNLIIHCNDISGGTVYATACYTKTTDQWQTV